MIHTVTSYTVFWNRKLRDLTLKRGNDIYRLQNFILLKKVPWKILITFPIFLKIIKRLWVINISQYFSAWCEPISRYFFKINNQNNRTICETCSKLIIKAEENCQAVSIALTKIYDFTKNCNCSIWKTIIQKKIIHCIGPGNICCSFLTNSG